MGSRPCPRAMVSLSIIRKIPPTKRVAISDRAARGLICSTPSHQIADPARGRRKDPRSRSPEKVAERDPNQDCDHEGQARNVAHHVAKVVRDRLVAGEERPGLEDEEEEDHADKGGHQEGEEIAPVENHLGPHPALPRKRREISLSSRRGILFLSPPPSCRSSGGVRWPVSIGWPGPSGPAPRPWHGRSAAHHR